MNGRNDMTAVYSELAPAFLKYLSAERIKIEKQVAKLRSASGQLEDAEERLDEIVDELVEVEASEEGEAIEDRESADEDGEVADQLSHSQPDQQEVF